jgi:superfamily II DNA or RNA helicase
MSTNKTRMSRRSQRDETNRRSRVPSFAVLKPGQQPADSRRPFLHQREAWDALTAANEEWKKSGKLEGLIVMPTASGKTFTAMTWAMRKVVALGQRIVWLAGSELLLEQAARAAHRSTGLVDARSQVAVRIVSGSHCSVKQIEPTDDVVICSVASLLRDPRAARRLLSAPDILAVVDESHHAAAVSYRKLIRMLPARHRLLGLTATPTRTRRDERPVLAGLFGDRIIYQVEHDVLVERGILARPVPIRVTTGIDLDRLIKPRDIKHLKQFKDLSPRTLEQIGKMESRNQIIVDHYLPRRERYGKTLIFVNSVRHAALLADRLTRAGARAEYIAAARLDDRSNELILDRFRDPAGDLEVIVCVLKLAEGVDLPKTQTVFLACPTGSEIRLRQMLGRALRGPAVGGTDYAYFVMFDDNCRLLRDYLDPLKLVPEVIGEAPYQTGPIDIAPSDPQPWPAVRDIARKLRDAAPSASTQADEAVPARWYILQPSGPDKPGLAVLIYCHQLAAWKAAIAFLAAQPAEDLHRVAGRLLLGEFFPGGVWLPPRVGHLDALVDHFQATGTAPQECSLEARNAADPKALARIIRAEDLGEVSRLGLIEESYTGLAPVIYTTLRGFCEAVNLELYWLAHPEERANSDASSPVFEVQAIGRCAAERARSSKLAVRAHQSYQSGAAAARGFRSGQSFTA